MFTQNINEATGEMTVHYNDGRISYYRQVAGFYEIQRQAQPARDL